MEQDKNRSLRINFIIPFAGKTGGVMVVLEYLCHLTRLGHSVEIYYPLFPYWSCTNTTERGSLAWRLLVHVVWFIQNIQKMTRTLQLFGEEVPVRPVLWVGSMFVRNADIIVATAWPTAFSVCRMSKSKGAKWYLVQGFENWAKNPGAALASYRLPIGIITVSPWISRKLKEQCGRAVASEVFNGLRHDKFYPPMEKSYDKTNILMMYSSQELKGAADGIDALARIKQEFPGVPVTLFGLEEKPSLLFDCLYPKDPPHDRLLNAYQAATVFLFPSRGEGWGLPAMEALACGCALIAARSGAVDALYSGTNAVIIRPGSSRSIYRALKLLVLSEERRSRLGKEGIKTTAVLSWERSAKQLASVFSEAPRRA